MNFRKNDIKKLMKYLTRNRDDCRYYDSSAPADIRCFYYYSHAKEKSEWNFEKCEGVCRFFKERCL